MLLSKFPRSSIVALLQGASIALLVLWLLSHWLSDEGVRASFWSRFASFAASEAPSWARARLKGATTTGFSPTDGQTYSEAAQEANTSGVEAARRQDWATAARHLREAFSREPGSRQIRRNLQQVLLAWAIDLVRHGRTEMAIRLLEEAQAVEDSEDVEYWLGRAWDAHGEPRRARQVWEAALLKYTASGKLLFALGEFWEAQQEHVRALEFFQRALAAGMDARGLRARVERLARQVEAEREYVVSRSARFDFRHPELPKDFPLDILISSFEDAYDHVRSVLGVVPRAPVPVVLYPEEQFHTVTNSPHWAGGAYSGRIQIPLSEATLSDRARLERVARHELVHALVAERGQGGAPLWLQEGLAMWVEDNTPGERVDWAREHIQQRPNLSFATLPTAFVELDRNAALTAYALSYLAMVFLIEEHGPRRVILLLEGTGNEDFSRRFEETLGQPYAAAVAEWEARVR